LSAERPSRSARGLSRYSHTVLKAGCPCIRDLIKSGANQVYVSERKTKTKNRHTRSILWTK
jgi:hypothetical protein